MAQVSTEGGSTTQSQHDTESASDVALSAHAQSESSEQEEDDNGRPKLTQKWLLAFLRKDWKHYYSTFELNEKLYLHFKGFDKLRCMELFPNLKTLYFEGNGLTEISGLEAQGELRCLYVHENCITEMAGLEHLVKLSNLNLSDNLITKIEGLENCVNLDMLYLARNRVGRNGVDDLRGLLACPSITTCDLQNCKIDDPAVLDEIFVNMPNLKVLYLQGNPVTSKIKNYRKTMISKLPLLKYLDDRPVFDDDRRNAEAFARGGLDEERQERARIQEEKRAKDEANRLAFKDMIRKAREEKKQAEDKAAADKPSQPAVENKENENSNGAAQTMQINTCEESKAAANDDELPPELEQVDSDQLKAENAKQSQEEKSKKQMYQQMRDNKAREDDDDEGCTVEEIVDEPAEENKQQEQPAAAVSQDDQIRQMTDMVKNINLEPEQEYVSNLEELD